MGIKSLKKFARIKAPSAFIKVPVSHFLNRVVAVDAHNLIFQHMSKAIDNTYNVLDGIDNRDVLIRSITQTLGTITMWASNGITPVFVFDGETTLLKSGTSESRWHKRNLAKLKVEETYKRIRENVIRSKEEEQELISLLRKQLRAANNIDKSSYDSYRNLFRALGIPCITAKYDGERLCSALNREKLAYAVLSADSDNLPFGASLIIEGRNREMSDKPYFDCIVTDRVLSELELNFNEFIDFCILNGTDFNNNLKKHGPVSNYGLIKTYKSIDLMPPKNLARLNHLEVRKEFATLKSRDLTDDPIPDKFEYTKPCFEDAIGIAGINNTARLYRFSNTVNSIARNSAHPPIKINELPVYTPPQSRYEIKFEICNP